jgi:hypothetical protein
LVRDGWRRGLASPQVCIAYVDAADDRRTRRSALRAAYLFDCACSRCGHALSASAELEAEAETRATRLRSTRDAALSAINNAQWADALALSRESRDLCTQLYPAGGKVAVALAEMQVAKLLSMRHSTGESLREAVDCWRRAIGLLAVAYGADSRLLHSAEAALRSLEPHVPHVLVADAWLDALD